MPVISEEEFVSRLHEKFTNLLRNRFQQYPGFWAKDTARVLCSLLLTILSGKKLRFDALPDELPTMMRVRIKDALGKSVLDLQDIQRSGDVSEEIFQIIIANLVGDEVSFRTRLLRAATSPGEIML